MCVALKINSADKELLALIDVDGYIDFIRTRNRLGIRLGNKVNVAKVAIELTQVVQALLEFLRREHIAGAHTKDLLGNQIRRAKQLHSNKLKIAYEVLLVLIDHHEDVGCFAGLWRLRERNMKTWFSIADGH